MPKFKAKNGDIIEVSDEHADQVLRKSSEWVEVKETLPEPTKEIVKKKVSKKKAKK